MDKIGTGGQLWPLKSASGELVTVTQGNPVTFQCNDLPDRAPTGPLAYFLMAVLLTFSGTLNQPESAGSTIPRDFLARTFFDSIDWTNSFFGAPLSKNFAKGTFWPIIEFLSGGFRYGQRQANPLPATGTIPFSFTFAVPACNSQLGRLGRDTSQLALLFQPSLLKVNTAAASVLDGFSTGATYSGLTVRATAVLMPRQEIVMATPMEWVLHEIAVGGASVKVTGFGRDTALTGVEDKGGVAHFMELTTQYASDAALSSPASITSINWQWRGQGELQDIHGWIDALEGAMPNDRPQVDPSVTAGNAGVSDFGGFPHTLSDSGFDDLTGLVAFPWVLGGHGLSLAELQTADTDETYYINPSSVFGGGSNHEILGCYARQWQKTKRDAFVAAVMQGGPNSLAHHVLLGKETTAKLQQRFPRDKHTLSPDQYTYLPWQFI